MQTFGFCSGCCVVYYRVNILQMRIFWLRILRITKKTQLVGLKTSKLCHNVLFQSIKMPNLLFKYNFVLKNKKTQDSVSILRKLKGRKCPPARHSAQNNGVGPWSLIISLLSAACWSTFAASLHLSVWWLQSGGGKRGHLPLWSSFIMSTSAFIALLGKF